MFWSMASSAGDRAPHSDFWYGPVGVGTASGQRVTPSAALALPAVYAAVKVITDAVMQIPLILYRRLPDGGKERAVDHPLYTLLHDVPNAVQTSPEWREVMQHHVLMRGNGYAEIGVDAMQRPGELSMPLHPDAVRTERVGISVRGVPQYRYMVREGQMERPVLSSRMLHVRGLGLGPDGLTGLSPIEMEREAVGVGLAAQDFTARFFANDARPGGWIEHPGNFKTREDRGRFRESFQEAQAGANRHKTAIFEYGMKYHPLEVKLVDAQFLETRKYQNIDIARIFRVPPHLIMELDRATFSNITQQDIEFVKFTLLPWLTRWERRLSFSLLAPEERAEYFFEFLVDGLERGDATSRSSYYNRGIQDGWMTRNEVRVRENLNPLPGLDEPLEPLNMTNPGGRNDGEFESLKRNAADALAKKWASDAAHLSAEEASHMIAGDWSRVARFMACGDAVARARCLELAEQLAADRPTSVVDWIAWQAEKLRDLR